MLEAIREQAHFVLLGLAEDADRNRKPHVAASERQMAEAALRGEIDTGHTIRTLVEALMTKEN